MTAVRTVALELERYTESEMRDRAQAFYEELRRRRTVRHFAPDAIPLDAIRAAAEEEERAFYGRRAPQRWLDDLAHLGTDADKPFLETAPALIAVFAQKHGAEADERHYYVQEPVGIAVGMLLAALHHAGLATLTHTPSPMKFLADVLKRPSNERAYVLIPVGYPVDGCRVPDIQRKPLGEVLVRGYIVIRIVIEVPDQQPLREGRDGERNVDIDDALITAY